MEMMKAAVLKDYSPRFEVEDVPKPVIEAPDDVIAKVLVCSICGTDVSLSSRPSPSYGDMVGRILGHEIVGEVTEVGPAVKSIKVGDRIVINPNSYCNTCEACRNGYRNHCKNMRLMGITVPGGFAEYVKTQEFLAFPVKKEVPLNHMVFAEPLSCAMNGFSRLDIHPGETCVVFGCGPIGLMFAQLARKCGARVVCVEPKDGRIAIAKKLGFTVLKPAENLKDQLITMWGRRANFCIDAAGRQLPVAVDCAEFRGTILCFATSRLPENGTLPNLGPIQGKELTIKGSFIIYDSMPKAITVIENDVIEFDPIVTHEIGLDEIAKGIELMRSGEGMEIIINIGRKEGE
ncbi:MAG: alcohol dehydrogenase catalytic domain-containing protein [Lachnospiraceae bacterium]|nr:alcohol dehydrogenase catalytic domain-containing protein [Lachnospiraceae bacterium]